MKHIVIDNDKCSKCGKCSDLCICIDIIRNEKKKIKEDLTNFCINCGQCVAVCSKGAINNLSLGTPPDINTKICSYDALSTLFKVRRSIRKYKKKSIPKKVMDKLLEAASFAPSGCNSCSPEIIIITNPQKLQWLESRFQKIFYFGSKIVLNPIVKSVLKYIPFSRTKSIFDPNIQTGAKSLKYKIDKAKPFITLGAPAIILFHATASKPTPFEDCVIMSYHILLAANTLGLGTCLNGNIVEALSLNIYAKEFGIPKGNKVYMALSIGYPDIKYHRPAPKKPVNVRFIT